MLGHGDTAFQRTPLVIAGLQGVRVRSVAAGDNTSLAVTIDGEAYGWGRSFVDDNGDVLWMPGLENTEDRLVPCKYPGLGLLTCTGAPGQ